MRRTDPNGITWTELEKQLFTSEEIKESEQRIEELIKKRQQEIPSFECHSIKTRKRLEKNS